MCSSTRGPAICRAHLRDGAGRGFGRSGPQGLDGIEDDEIRALLHRQRGEDVFDIRFGGELHVGFGGVEPLGAQANLGDGFLAGDIDDAVALAG